MTDDPTWTAAIVVDGDKKRVLAIAPLADEAAADRWTALKPMTDAGDFNIAVQGDMAAARKGILADYLGCVRDATVLFELRGVRTDKIGVFGHVTVPLMDNAGDGKVCPICGDPLERVPAPDPGP